MDDLQYALNLSKTIAISLAEHKDKTYPKIPKKYSIQKCMLKCDSREKEVELIDKILDLNIDFKLFIFYALKSSFSQLDENVAKIFNINKYFKESGIYYNNKYILREGSKSSTFCFFVGRYLKYKKIVLTLPENILVNKIFYDSMKWLHLFSTKTFGQQILWDLVNSYIK